MVIRCLSFGSLWWLRPGNRKEDSLRFSAHAAVFNTTGFNLGSRNRRLWLVAGVIRINLGTQPRSHDSLNLIEESFESTGLERWGQWNRVLLGRRRDQSTRADKVLQCARSSVYGRINFDDEWHDRGIQVIAGSAFRGHQEALILADPGAQFETVQGSWEVTWNGIRPEEVIDEGTPSPAGSRRGNFQFNEKRDLPMILAVRNATFISHGQLYAQLLAQGTELNRQGFCWRLKRLVGVGVIQKMPQIFPFSGPTYTITRQGLACLEICGEGLISITSESKSLPNPKQAPHYLELAAIRSALRKAGVLKTWIGDLELRSMNLSIDVPLAKDYDAVADLTVDGKSICVAVEYERTAKASVRYKEIVAAIREEEQIELLMYLTASMDLVYQLKAEFEELQFPIAIAPSGAFCSDPLSVRMHTTLIAGQKKANIIELVRAISNRSDVTTSEN